MTYHSQILVEVAEGALGEMDAEPFTGREFGKILHESMRYLPVWDRYPKPLQRGATAGQVLRRLREKGLVVRTGRTGQWRPL